MDREERRCETEPRFSNISGLRRQGRTSKVTEQGQCWLVTEKESRNMGDHGNMYAKWGRVSECIKAAHEVEEDV